MKISWGEDYAVIFMSKLADSYEKKLVPLSEVSREFKISLSFLKQLAIALKKRGLITSKEGVTGGYALAKKPGDISLYDVLASFNQASNLTICCHGIDGHTKTCPRQAFCKTKKTWLKINQDFIRSLSSVTLSDL